jgi:hypothetical protein
MLLDVVVLGIPVLFGLLVMWLGIRRFLLSLPVRILDAMLVAWLVSAAASLYIVAGAHSLDAVSQRLDLPPAIALSAISWLAYLIVLLAVLVVLSRISTRVLQNATHNVGVVPSVSRFVVGAACGLILVICLAVPTLMFAAAFQPDPNQLAAQFQGSITFPLLKSIGDRVQTWMQATLPSSLESPGTPPGP